MHIVAFLFDQTSTKKYFGGEFGGMGFMVKTSEWSINTFAGIRPNRINPISQLDQ